MSDENRDDGYSRRFALECMTWAGTGVLWTFAGGVPASQLIGRAEAATTGFSFVQISDSHIGFSKPANPDTRATLTEAVNRISAMTDKPAFMLHTGDITHLAKPGEFDDAEKIIGSLKLDVHYVPGEHDMIDEGGKAYIARYGKNTKGKGWYSFDHEGVHFIGLVNVSDVVHHLLRFIHIGFCRSELVVKLRIGHLTQSRVLHRWTV